MPAQKTATSKRAQPPTGESLPKTLTGVQGLDEITFGGLPKGRTTLICGGAGSGKTLLALQFIVNGIQHYGEPGVYVSFEELAPELRTNVASMGIDLRRLEKAHQVIIDEVQIERSEIEETGEYSLDGLFIRLANAIDTVKAKRVALDTIEVLFAGLKNESIIRAELRRLFRWLKDKGVTAIVTGERGEGSLTRYGLEEYVADCVILLDHRVSEQISTRRIRVVKYRGTLHGTDEYPFLMTADGVSVLPITSLGLAHEVSRERISSGVAGIDDMLGGKGFFRGSSILVSGAAGTGKSSVAAHFAKSGCERGEHCVYFGFEEASKQIIRNMESIGLRLQPWVDKGLLHFNTVRPSTLGLEAHLVSVHDFVQRLNPQLMIVDSVTNLTGGVAIPGVQSMLTRLIDFLKTRHVTTLFTHLSGAAAGMEAESTVINISSLIDTWLLLRRFEQDGRRRSGVYVLKSRGMDHSREIKAFELSDSGIRVGETVKHTTAAS